MKRRSWFALAAAVAVAGAVLSLRQWRPDVEAIVDHIESYDMALGERLYQRYCRNCHGGLAPDLSHSRINARNDRRGLVYLVESIVVPEKVIAGTGKFVMPDFRLAEAEVGSIVLYMIRSRDFDGK